jgi:hypothetical protein
VRAPGVWRCRSALRGVEAQAAGRETLPASAAVGRRRKLDAPWVLAPGSAAGVAWRHGIHLSAQSAVPRVTTAAAGIAGRLEPQAWEELAPSQPRSELVKPAAVGMELRMVSEPPAVA